MKNEIINIRKKKRKATGRKFGLSGRHLKRWIKAKLQIYENPTFFKKLNHYYKQLWNLKKLEKKESVMSVNL